MKNYDPVSILSLRLPLAGICLFMCASIPLEAALLVSDDFEGYPQGLISSVTAPSKTGLSGDWSLNNASDFYVNQTEADSTAGNPGEGKAVYDRNGTNNNDRTATRSLAGGSGADLNTPGDVLYLGFDLDPASVGGSEELAFGLNFDNGAFIQFGIFGGGYTASGSNGTASGGTATADAQRIILRIQFQDGAENTKLWVDATSESDAAVFDDSSQNLLNTSPAPYVGSSIFIRGQNQSGQPAYFDNLMIGESFNDVSVIPEPSSFLLLLSGLSVLVVFRRAKRR